MLGLIVFFVAFVLAIGFLVYRFVDAQRRWRKVRKDTTWYAVTFSVPLVLVVIGVAALSIYLSRAVWKKHMEKVEEHSAHTQSQESPAREAAYKYIRRKGGYVRSKKADQRPEGSSVTISFVNLE